MHLLSLTFHVFQWAMEQGRELMKDLVTVCPGLSQQKKILTGLSSIELRIITNISKLSVPGTPIKKKKVCPTLAYAKARLDMQYTMLKE